MSLHFCFWKWWYTALTHKIEQLSWELHQSLLGELMWVVFEFVEGNKLNDVRLGILLVNNTVESLFVTI
jgi:hypothetical protein